jgi:hypothetical protein
MRITYQTQGRVGGNFQGEVKTHLTLNENSLPITKTYSLVRVL